MKNWRLILLEIIKKLKEENFKMKKRKKGKETERKSRKVKNQQVFKKYS